MKTAPKVVLVVGATVAGAAALYFLFKKSGVSLVPSSPSEWDLPSFTTTSEWSLPSFTTTTEFLSTPPMLEVKKAPQVEVIPYGSPCRTDAQCAAGICINGECAPESDWS